MMQPNTINTLGKLRAGDRFVFRGKTDPWQVIKIAGRNVFINQFEPDGTKVYKHDDVKKADVNVKFLRHTIPETGEIWQLKFLKVGAVFCQKDELDITKEYQVQENKYPHETVSCITISHENAPIQFPGQTEVIFLKNI